MSDKQGHSLQEKTAPETALEATGTAPADGSGSVENAASPHNPDSAALGDIPPLPPLRTTDHLRGALFLPGLALITLVLGIVFLPWLALPRRFSWLPIRTWTRSVLLLLRGVAGIRCEIRGAEFLPRDGGILASRHESAWETLIFLLLLEDPSVVLKKELLSIPVYGWFVRKAGMIPIDRAGGAGALRRMVREARDAAESGRPVIIFPEGTRVRPGEAARFMPGITALYDNLDKPVIPVALNSGIYWGRALTAKRPGTIILKIMPPLEKGLPRRKMVALLEQSIASNSQALEQEARLTLAGKGRSQPVRA